MCPFFPSSSEINLYCNLLFVMSLQHVEGDYGLYTWPCAPMLAYLVHTHRDWVKGKRVLEVSWACI